MTKVPFTFDWHPLVAKAGRLFTYTFDHFPKQLASVVAGVRLRRYAHRAVGAEHGRPPKAVPARGRRARAQVDGVDDVRPPRRRGPVGDALVRAALRALAVRDPRAGVALSQPYPRPTRRSPCSRCCCSRGRICAVFRALALAPGVLAALAMDVTVLRQLRAFGDNPAPFLDLIHAVPRGSRVLPLINKDTDPACAFDPYNQFHSYLYGRHSTATILPLRQRRQPAGLHPELPPRRFPRWAVAGEQITLEQQGKTFDFILVQGARARSLSGSVARLAAGRVHRVAEGGYLGGSTRSTSERPEPSLFRGPREGPPLSTSIRCGVGASIRPEENTMT